MFNFIGILIAATILFMAVVGFYFAVAIRRIRLSIEDRDVAYSFPGGGYHRSPEQSRYAFLAAAGMAFLITLALIGASLYIILAGSYTPETECWATTVIGSLIGFWVTPTALILLRA